MLYIIRCIFRIGLIALMALAPSVAYCDWKFTKIVETGTAIPVPVGTPLAPGPATFSRLFTPEIDQGRVVFTGYGGAALTEDAYGFSAERGGVYMADIGGPVIAVAEQSTAGVHITDSFGIDHFHEVSGFFKQASIAGDHVAFAAYKVGQNQHNNPDYTVGGTQNTMGVFITNLFNQPGERMIPAVGIDAKAWTEPFTEPHEIPGLTYFAGPPSAGGGSVYFHAGAGFPVGEFDGIYRTGYYTTTDPQLVISTSTSVPDVPLFDYPSIPPNGPQPVTFEGIVTLAGYERGVTFGGHSLSPLADKEGNVVYFGRYDDPRASSGEYSLRDGLFLLESSGGTQRIYDTSQTLPDGRRAEAVIGFQRVGDAIIFQAADYSDAYVGTYVYRNGIVTNATNTSHDSPLNVREWGATLGAGEAWAGYGYVHKEFARNPGSGNELAFLATSSAGGQAIYAAERFTPVLATNLPENHTFHLGTVRSGTPEAMRTVDFVNTGDDGLKVAFNNFYPPLLATSGTNIGWGNADYYSGPSLAHGEAGSLTFSPRIGFNGASFVMPSNAGDVNVHFTGNVVGPELVLTGGGLEANSYEFSETWDLNLGDVLVGTSLTIDFQLANYAAQSYASPLTDLTIRQQSIFGNDGDRFSVTGLPNGTVVGAGRNRLFQVVFNPIANRDDGFAVWSIDTDLNAPLGLSGDQVEIGLFYRAIGIGGSAPGMSSETTLASIQSSAASGSQSAFIATVSGPQVASGEDAGVWGRRDGLTFTPLAFAGRAVPSLAESVIFGNEFSTLSINSRGQTSFVAELNGRINAQGLFATDALGQTVLVTHVGADYDTSRSVASLGVAPRMQNDGHLAYQIVLSDATAVDRTANLSGATIDAALSVNPSVVLDSGGALRFHGTDSADEDVGRLTVGLSDQGALTIANFTELTVRDVEIGVNMGANGSVLITAGGLSAQSASLGGTAVSAGGSGSLEVSNGTVTLSTRMSIWGQGRLLIGSGSTLTSEIIEVHEGGLFTAEVFGAVYGDVTLTGEYRLNGLHSGDVSLQPGGVLKGAGQLHGLLGGAGTLAVGNSPGVLDVLQVDPTTGIDFLIEFTSANILPDFLDRTASINDVLHLTHADTPFLSALTPDNVVTVDFQVGSLAHGDVFYGGFFTNEPGDDFYGDGTVENALYNYLFNGSLLDSNLWQVSVSTVPQFGVDFGSEYGGIVDGRLMQFTLQQTAVPEPGSLALVGVAAAGWLWKKRRRRAVL